MSPARAANCVVLCAVLSGALPAFADSPSPAPLQAPAGCREEDYGPYGLLNQFIYLLPVEPGKKDLFIPGGISPSDETLQKD